MLKHVKFIITSLFLTSNLLMANRCCQIMNRNPLKFKLIRHHTRSTRDILLGRMLSSVKQCEEFAISKKALAFNFHSLDISLNSTTKIEELPHNCQVLGCPETNLAHTLVSDLKFSYYSLYSRRRMPVNDSVICLPRVGLFVASRKFENYSNAQAQCTKMYGKLAHIMSAERSVGLSKYIGETSAFVGLSNQGRDHLWKNEFGIADEPLSCFQYRAWGNREPSSRGCVTLTKLQTQSSSSLLSYWKVVPCSYVLPFICEIFPNFR